MKQHFAACLAVVGVALVADIAWRVPAQPWTHLQLASIALGIVLMSIGTYFLLKKPTLRGPGPRH